MAFIILIIKGRATKDEILEENSHIYYCPNCNSTFSQAGSKDEYCPKCYELLYETTVLTDDWRKYTDSRKDNLKQEFKNGQLLRNNIGIVTPVANNQNTNADELLKYKQLLDAGAITPEEYEIKKKQLLDL